jgi:putative transcriptional regulator
LTRRHPDDETLALLAFGRLKTGARLVVGAHLRFCAQCRAAVAALEAVGGDMLETAEPSSLSGDALARALGRLDEPPQREAAPVDIDALVKKGWWLPAGPGVFFKPLSRYAEPGERLYLLKARAGTALPEHGHEGCERLVVLEGAFDNDGEVLEAGDFAGCDEAVVHQPGALSHTGCVCIAATDGRLRLKGPARWIQPLLGV